MRISLQNPKKKLNSVNRGVSWKHGILSFSERRLKIMNISVFDNSLDRISMDLRIANILTILKGLHESGYLNDKEYEKRLLLINEEYSKVI